MGHSWGSPTALSTSHPTPRPQQREAPHGSPAAAATSEATRGRRPLGWPQCRVPGHPGLNALWDTSPPRREALGTCVDPHTGLPFHGSSQEPQQEAVREWGLLENLVSAWPWQSTSRPMGGRLRVRGLAPPCFQWEDVCAGMFSSCTVRRRHEPLGGRCPQRGAAACLRFLSTTSGSF